MMRCVFVLDLFNGEVVHAVRGERDKYVSIEKSSLVVDTSDPIQILETLAPREVYVADLDRITGSGDNLDVIGQISERARTMADIGISSIEDVELLPRGCIPVLGTETASLDLIKKASDIRDVTVSVDLISGRVLTQDPALQVSPLDLIRELNDPSLKEIILLALDRVGTSEGFDDLFLRSAALESEHELLLGGGVKDESDLDELKSLGLAGALVATALHLGKVPLERIR